VRTIRLIAVLIALSPTTVWGQVSPQTPEGSWSWFENCSDKRTLALEVLLNGRQIYQSSIPICKVSAPKPPAASKQKIVAFHFKGGHVFQGEYHTSAAQTIEGNLWQAGAEPDMLLLGLSFSTKTQLLLNTVHYAKPHQKSVTTLDRGLLVKTFPIDLPQKK
jgi:hypothetical protein